VYLPYAEVRQEHARTHLREPGIIRPRGHARVPRPHPEQEAWKRQVLAGEIELEEIDTQPFRNRYGPNSLQPRPAQAAE